jgi:hypothetical protein
MKHTLLTLLWLWAISAAAQQVGTEQIVNKQLHKGEFVINGDKVTEKQMDNFVNSNPYSQIERRRDSKAVQVSLLSNTPRADKNAKSNHPSTPQIKPLPSNRAETRFKDGSSTIVIEYPSKKQKCQNELTYNSSNRAILPFNKSNPYRQIERRRDS